MKFSTLIVLTALILLTFQSSCGCGAVSCPSGQCQYPIYIEGCYKYASSNACAQCQYNYIKNGSRCDYSPPKDNTDCCLSFAKNGQCNKCAKGLILKDGICKDTKIIGCIQKGQNGCINCAKEYTIRKGRCFKIINNCLEYNSDGSCYQCINNFLKIGNYCVKDYNFQCLYPFSQDKNGNCVIEGCLSTFQLGCQKCAQGYALLPDGSCKFGIISGCSRYNDKGKCVDCLRPYYSNKDGSCIPIGCLNINNKGNCQKCDQSKGFTLISQGYCAITNCLLADQKGCLVCSAGYVPNQSGCIPNNPISQCTVCSKGFHLDANQNCVPNDPGCSKYKNGNCYQCYNQFYLSQDYKCLKKLPGCLYKNGICFECYSPYKYRSDKRNCIIQGCKTYFDDGCQQCDSPFIKTKANICTLPNCIEIDNLRCIKCQQSYLIDNDGNCQKIDPYCQTYDLKFKCLRCQMGYYMGPQGKCKKENFGCNYVDGRCTSCRTPFTYNSKTESCEIDGCIKYFLGGCQQCDNGYDLRYNSCKLPNCLISVLGKCKQCDPDYIMRSDGKCVNKDEFCYKYNNDGYCIQCAPKYFLSSISNKCVLRQPGCNYNNKDQCVSCDKPFYYDGVRCDIYGCNRINYQGCQQCFYPLKVNSLKLCQVQNCDRMQNGKCKICKQGYFIYKDGSCKINDPKCIKYSDTNSNCAKCAKGYKVDKSGRCQYVDQNCQEFTQQGNCNNCDRLYFLNVYKKCQLKDSNCKAYSNGFCQQCSQLYYNYQGLCYPNAKGCLVQKNIKQCIKCSSDYKLQYGKCTPQITRLSYNSINMDDDFFKGDTDKQKQQAKLIFTLGKDNKQNLVSAIKKNAKIYYSSSITTNIDFQVDSQGANGWTIQKNSQDKEYIGVELTKLETFYAVDIKSLKGNKLTKFLIQYSEDNRIFKKVGQFNLSPKIDGSVQTYYFTPVYAISIRIVVLQGLPNIKFDFYYSFNITQQKIVKTDNYITQTLQTTIGDSITQMRIYAPNQECVDKQLCYLGLEICQAREIYGFNLVPAQNNNGSIDQVYVDFSIDGIKFQCYDGCNPIKVTNNQVKLPRAVIGSKLRAHITKWQGKPNCGIKFNYKNN